MSRHRLHVSDLVAFAEYCANVGWTRVDPKGDYEVLRMTRPGGAPLIVHTRLATHRGNPPVHLTLHGIAEKMFSQYKRATKPSEVQS